MPRNQSKSKISTEAKGTGAAAGIQGSSRPVVYSQPGFSPLPFLPITRQVNAASIVSAFSVPPVMQTIIPVAKVAFPGYDIVPHPPEGTKASDQQLAEAKKGLKQADKVVKSLQQVRAIFYDLFGFRNSILNYSLETVGNWTLPAAFEHLPAESFSKSPTTMADPDRYWRDSLLRGIVIDRKDNTKHYYQAQTRGGDPVEIPVDQILHIIEETPGNKSHLEAILPTIDFWAFCRKALALTVQRTGIPNAVASTSIEAMRLWSGDGTSQNPGVYDGPMTMGIPTTVWDHLEKIVKLQSTGNAFNLPPGSSLSYPTVNQPLRATDVDQYVKRDILNAIIPTNILDTLGSAISKSGQPSLDLFILLAAGWRELCAKPLEDWFTWLLELNGFEDGWTVEFQWWDIVPEDINATSARVVADFNSGLLLINEARLKQGYSALPDGTNGEKDEVSRLIDQYQRLHGKVPSPVPNPEAVASQNS
jgi:hypothetical protein